VVSKRNEKIRTMPRNVASSEDLQIPGFEPGRHDECMRISPAEPWKRRLQEAIKLRANSNHRQVSIKAGLAPTTVRVVLLGTNSTSVSTALSICNILQISVEWLLGGTGEMVHGARQAAATENDGQSTGALQLVPVFALSNAHNALDGGVPMRIEPAEKVDISGRRFRVIASGNSMLPTLADGDVLDVSSGMIPDPEDVVIVWIESRKNCVVRKILPTYSDDGLVSGGELLPYNATWPKIRLTSADKILGVAFDCRRPLRQVRRP
jgi:Peptidase S24-like